MGVSLRNSLYDWGTYKSVEFDIPIVCVGNLTVGGTGKTPMTEYLVQLLSQRYNVAVLSRGYKRRTSGFIIAKPDMSYRRIGDEPKQIKIKFPTIPVAVCESRVQGIRRLREMHPEVNLIILDDAFQHRAAEAWVNIVLMDYNRPIYHDKLLPVGRLRDKRSSMLRAHMIVTTKCPTNLTPLDCRIVRKYLELSPYQSLYFSKVSSSEAMPLFPALSGGDALPTGAPVIVMASLANPRGFLEHCTSKYNVVGQAIYKDHHALRMRDIAHVEQQLLDCPVGTVVVMTEKDAVKLMNSRKISEATLSRMYCVSINVRMENCGEFARILWQYVAKNQKYNITHPE